MSLKNASGYRFYLLESYGMYGKITKNQEDDIKDFIEESINFVEKKIKKLETDIEYYKESTNEGRFPIYIRMNDYVVKLILKTNKEIDRLTKLLNKYKDDLMKLYISFLKEKLTFEDVENTPCFRT